MGSFGFSHLIVFWYWVFVCSLGSIAWICYKFVNLLLASYMYWCMCSDARKVSILAAFVFRCVRIWYEYRYLSLNSWTCFSFLIFFTWVGLLTLWESVVFLGWTIPTGSKIKAYFTILILWYRSFVMGRVFCSCNTRVGFAVKVWWPLPIFYLQSLCINEICDLSNSGCSYK